MLAKGCALRPGASIIKASLVTAIQSEVAGQAVAQVTEDVYDADGVGRLLIPQGTRVVGVYKSRAAMTFDRERLDFGWTQMTLPDGTQIDLGQADGGDASGASGVGGKVTTPWGNVIATAALLSVFDAMATVPGLHHRRPDGRGDRHLVGRSTPTSAARSRAARSASSPRSASRPAPS